MNGFQCSYGQISRLPTVREKLMFLQLGIEEGQPKGTEKSHPQMQWANVGPFVTFSVTMTKCPKLYFDLWFAGTVHHSEGRGVRNSRQVLSLHPSQEAGTDGCWCSPWFIISNSHWDFDPWDGAAHTHNRPLRLSQAFVVTTSQTCPEVCLPGKASQLDNKDYRTHFWNKNKFSSFWRLNVK